MCLKSVCRAFHCSTSLDPLQVSLLCLKVETASCACSSCSIRLSLRNSTRNSTGPMARCLGHGLAPAQLQGTGSKSNTKIHLAQDLCCQTGFLEHPHVNLHEPQKAAGKMAPLSVAGLCSSHKSTNLIVSTQKYFS